ncbi:thiol-disulfide oxidoreductase DCC family protein [Pseudoalteromonas byunsanensis]|uniref:Cell division protein n=1 Tax=Pseudoalteromonas byunsanensis TaxID=327939 RepID=A0A1S1N552_9GAMM|nr:DUF393 domain-containing protein [Pseudoalteromonas byunsanensis]OHU94446.1 hypothetical protein BIW53_15335 [Pseudoalteromonas byunsanensis]
MKIFYDGQCPICVAEMKKLLTFDQHRKIVIVDVHEQNFAAQYPHIDKRKALTILHAEDENGQIFLGLDATYQIWKLVGKYRWLKVLRLYPIRWLADGCYWLFARNRMRLSRMLLPSRCNNDRCKPND